MYAIVVNSEEELLEVAKKHGLKVVVLEEGFEMPKEENVDCSCNINEFLLSLGIRPHIKGFRYLKYIFENDLNCDNDITTVLYPTIAKAFNTTPSRVERAIRHAIETALYSSSMSNLYAQLFGQFGEKPTNHQFLVGCKLYLEKSKK